MNKETIIVSACLLGVNCKYNGSSNYNAKIEQLKEKYNMIPVCPEVMGDLPIPRTPSEIVGDRVINKVGNDVTNNYLDGANKVLKIALENSVKLAIFKAKSPSCGSGKVYDGSFTSTLIDGDGVTSRLLKEYGIRILTEEDL